MNLGLKTCRTSQISLKRTQGCRHRILEIRAQYRKKGSDDRIRTFLLADNKETNDHLTKQ